MEKKIFLLGYILSFSLLHGQLITLEDNTTFDEVSHLCQATPDNTPDKAVALGKKYMKSSNQKGTDVYFLPNPQKKKWHQNKWRYINTKNHGEMSDDKKFYYLELTWLKDQTAFEKIKINKFHSDDTSYPLMKIKFAPNSNAVPITQNNQSPNYTLMPQGDIKNAFINKVNDHQDYLKNYLINEDLYFNFDIATLNDHINYIHQKTLERYFQRLLPGATATHYNNLALIFTGYFEEIDDIKKINHNLSYIENNHPNITYALVNSSLSPEYKVNLFLNITHEALKNILNLFNNLTLTQITPVSFSKLFNKILQHSIADENFNLEDKVNKIIEFHNYFSPLKLDDKDYCKLLNSYLFNEEVFNILCHLIDNCNEEQAIIWKLLLKNNILRSKFLNSVILKAQKENSITEDNINEEFIKIYDFIDTICNIASNINISSFIIDCLCAYPSLIIPFLQEGNGFDFQDYDSISSKINSCFIEDNNNEIIINPIIHIALQDNIETIINALQENNQAILAWLTPEFTPNFYNYLLDAYFKLSGLETEDEEINAKVKNKLNITPLVQWLFQTEKDIENRYNFLINFTKEDNKLTFFTEYAINNVELLNFMMETDPFIIFFMIKIIQQYAQDLIQNCSEKLNLKNIINKEDIDQIFSTPNKAGEEILQSIISEVNNELNNTYETWFNDLFIENATYRNLLKTQLPEIIKNEVIDNLTFNIVNNCYSSIIVTEINNDNDFAAPTQEEAIQNIINENPGWGKRFFNSVCNHKITTSLIGAVSVIIGIYYFFKKTPKEINGITEGKTMILV